MATKRERGRPKKWTKKALKEIADEMLLWFEKEDNIFFKEFLLSKDLYLSFLTDAMEMDTYFSQTCDKCKELQHMKLLNGGVLIKKGYNPSMVKFLLINDHGYVSEKTQQQVQIQDKDNIHFDFGNNLNAEDEEE